MADRIALGAQMGAEMKKFMKGCAITALVIAIIGVILFSAGAFGGGLRAVRGMSWNGFSNFRNYAVQNWDWNWDFHEWDDNWNNNWNNNWEESWAADYNLNDTFLFDDSYHIYEGESVQFTEEAGVVRNLKLELAGSDVYVLPSYDDIYRVEISGPGRFQAYVKDDTLHVKGLKRGSNWRLGYNTVYIYVPDGTTLDKADIELGAGAMDIEYLSADTITIEVGAGSLSASELTARELDVEVGAGEINIDSFHTIDMEVSVDAGVMNAYGAIKGNLDAVCNMGSLEIDVQNSSQDAHNYKLDCAMGTIQVGSHSYTSLASDREIKNGASSTFDLECAMGQIVIDF